MHPRKPVPRRELLRALAQKLSAESLSISKARKIGVLNARLQKARANVIAEHGLDWSSPKFFRGQQGVKDLARKKLKIIDELCASKSPNPKAALQKDPLLLKALFDKRELGILFGLAELIEIRNAAIRRIRSGDLQLLRRRKITYKGQTIHLEDLFGPTDSFNMTIASRRLDSPEKRGKALRKY